MTIPFMRVLAFIGAICPVLAVAPAGAQCTASDVLRRQAMHKAAVSSGPSAVIKAWIDAPVWKRISIGTFPDSLALRNALDHAGCSRGDLAEEVLARSSFHLSVVRADLDLVSLSAFDLGLPGDAAALADIYARAEKLGFRLAPAEVGPQLRLQYLDQPVGEFLDVAMEPLRTWSGEPTIFVVASGGEGLLLVGQNVAVHQIPIRARFLFVRPTDLAARACADCAAAEQGAQR